MELWRFVLRQRTSHATPIRPLRVHLPRRGEGSRRIFLPPHLPLRRRLNRRDHFLIQPEQVLDAFALGGEGGFAVEAVNGEIERSGRAFNLPIFLENLFASKRRKNSC